MSRGRPWQRAELTYCSNVHPGEHPAEVQRTSESIAGVRRRRGLARMGTGLWLSRRACQALQRDGGAALAALLARHGLALFTLNGFPAGDFHAQQVKTQVYRPDWSEPERYVYTLVLARLLAACLPEDSHEGTISSLPLGFKARWNRTRHERALDALCSLAAELAALELRCDKRIRVCLEMEPGCVLERTEDTLRLFGEALPRAARRQGLRMETLWRHLGICFDVCHQAVMFEDTGAALTALQRAGIPIGKIQLSSALEVPQPSDPDVLAALARYAEPRYLHQVGTRAAGRFRAADDLGAALADPAFPRSGPWRVHFHVPVHAAQTPEGLRTTQGEILTVLDFLAAHPDLHPHLEVETYTWEVLPPGLRPRSPAQLLDNLAAELAWVEQAMAARGLLEA